MRRAGVSPAPAYSSQRRSPAAILDKRYGKSCFGWLLAVPLGLALRASLRVASTSATASKLTSNPGRSPGLSQCPPLRRSRDRFTGPINPPCTFADCNQLGLQLQVAGVCLWLSDRLGDDCTRRWPYRAKWTWQAANLLEPHAVRRVYSTPKKMRNSLVFCTPFHRFGKNTLLHLRVFVDSICLAKHVFNHRILNVSYWYMNVQRLC